MTATDRIAVGDTLRALFDGALAAAEPRRALEAHIPKPVAGRTVVVGAGKASAAMAQAFEALWSGPLEGLVLTRSGEIGPRPPGVIGLQALRGGDNPGEHTVFFLGEGERLELTHRAATREHFARGALRAARWVLGQEPGLYAMEDVLGLRP